MEFKSTCAAAFLLMMLPTVSEAACGVERWPVRTATDPHASQVRLSPLPATIDTLRAIPAPRPLPQDARVAPVETTIYSVTATLMAYRITPESDIHLVLSDDAGRTMIARIPAPACAGGSRFLPEIANARSTFERRYPATETFREVRQPVEVQGVGFFDFFQGQRGLAPNGLTLQPVTAISFTPAFRPKGPPSPGRRRSVGGGGPRNCVRPSLSIAASRGTACAGETVTMTWQASSPAAIVHIDGIGTSLPSSGSRVVTPSSSAAFSGRASTSCGVSDETVAVVTVTPAATASLLGPSSVSAGTNATLSVSTSGAASWTLSSSLGNSISPSSGSSNRSVTYSATRSGTDVVTLVASGGGCGSVTRTHTIFVSSPPSNTGLRCCDGTRSPTCFNCADKRGCCSSHGGVCGCP